MSADVEHLTCQEFVEVLTAYLEDALDPAERAEIERHIVICRGCTNYVEQMRSTIDLLGRMPADDGGDRHREQLLSMFRAWQAKRS
ncbi:MAG TPA: zf-HC2 domain-containing protein [Solirubrobacteraceae bacterium]|nr:zf-HC2 domain-containing protein [Solirubrobacteraceae bacterium]